MVEASGYNRLTVFSMILLLLGMSASMGFSSEDSTILVEGEPHFETSRTSTPHWPGSQSGSIYTYDSVDVGMAHACAVASDNTVRCWGWNNEYQIGNQTTWGNDEVSSPRVVDYIGGHSEGTNLAVSIGAGGYHNCAIETDGTLKCWGFDSYRQLGTNRNNDSSHSLYPFPVWDLDDSSQSEVRAIDAGLFHTCAIVDEISGSTSLITGRVACWGRNNMGQIGTNTSVFLSVETPAYVVDSDGNQLQNVTSMSSGRNHNCAVVGGNAMCWGHNQNGALGNESQVGEYSVSYAVNVTTLQHTQRQVVAIGAGYQHTCALLDNGSIGCWGVGDDEEFGDGTISETELYNARYVSLPAGRTAIALEVGDDHNCAILDDNSTWCWGKEGYGQRGDGGVGGATPTQVQTSGYHFTSISAGESNTCGISNTSQLYCWGFNARGTVGSGSSAYQHFSPQLVQLGPSTQNGPQQYPLIHDRDPDGDGILSIFDSTPLLPDCLPGTYNIIGIGCVDTDPGYYQDKPHESFQIPCPPGTYQPNYGSPICLDAPPGFYVSANASTSATPCPAGNQQPSAGQTECIGVDPGHFTRLGTGIQIPCIAGTYQPQTNQSSCLPSNPGYHVPTDGQINQTICPSGTYQPGYGRPTCYEADPGNHVSQAGSLAQEACQVGSYADVIGLSECKLASPGYYVNSVGATNQIACSAGEYQPDSGQTSCNLVDAGYYSNSASSSMIACEVGYYQESPGSISCIAADPGFYVNSEGSTLQNICPAGTYSENVASPECTQADPGYYSSNDGSTGQEICDAGSYSSVGSDSCQLADAGYISAEAGSPEQIACPVGTFQPSEGSTECILSDPGHYVEIEASSSQLPCSAGTYQPDSGQSSCILASSGEFVPDEGATSPSECAIGTYQPSTGQSTCERADVGHFVDIEASEKQFECNFGTYQPDLGQEACIDSDPGHFVDLQGSSAQTPCSPGSYQPESGMMLCYDASEGHYVELEGASEQTECDSGYSQPITGQTSCIQNEEEFPMTMIFGGGIVLIGIVTMMVLQYQKKPSKKGIHRPPQGAKRKKKTKGKNKPKQ